uniref:Uncharacterized protein n=1 Tax=Anguilla anguilla TaxID=7936 RepID=A0A0E9W370_ANGAN
MTSNFTYTKKKQKQLIWTSMLLFLL